MSTLSLLAVLSQVAHGAEPVDLMKDRLVDPVRPVTQAISLVLNPQEQGLTGSTQITLNVLERTDHFRLHAKEITLTGPVTMVRKKKRRSAKFEQEGQFLVITMDKPLKKGEYTLELEFEADYGKSVGLYKSFTGDNTFLISQFEASDARTVFPCFDEPSFKIPFELQITAPTGQTVLSNTAIKQKAESEGFTTFTFEPTKPLPTYLVAMSVGPFVQLEIPGLSIPGHIYTPPGTEPLTTVLANQTAPLLEDLQRWFGEPMAYGKLDYVIASQFAFGGMENPGLIVFSERMLVSEQAPASARARVAEVVAHEIAHQWFGNLVTPDWWDDLWLNESFASWMGMRSRGRVFTDLPGEFDPIKRAYGAMSSDGAGSMRPIRSEIDPLAVFQSANFIAYPKGQAVLSMVERWIGAEAFQLAVQDHLKNHRDQTATAADLFDAFEERSNQPVGEVLAPFLDRPGAAKVSFVKAKTGWEVTQERYFVLGAKKQEAEPWPIPLVIRYSKDGELHTHSVLIKEASQTLDLDADWILPTADGVGYFVWELQREALRSLLDHADELSTAEVVGVLENLQLLLDSGDLDLGELLAAHKALAANAPVAAVPSMLKALKTVSLVQSEDSEEVYAAFLNQTYGPLLDKLTLNPTGTEEEKALRTKLMSLLGADAERADVLDHWKSTVHQFLQDPSSVPHQGLSAALKSVAKTEDLDFQAQMLANALGTSDPALHRIYLGAFATVEGKEARERALSWALEEGRTFWDMMNIVQTVFRKKEDLPAKLSWVFENYEQIKENASPRSQSHFLGHFYGGSCELERFNEGKSFFLDPSRVVPGAEQMAKEVEESVYGCIAAKKQHSESLATFFEDYRPPSQ